MCLGTAGGADTMISWCIIRHMIDSRADNVRLLCFLQKTLGETTKLISGFFAEDGVRAWKQLFDEFVDGGIIRDSEGNFAEFKGICKGFEMPRNT